jgi:phage terminase small subunit
MDWKSIRKEFETTGISLIDLADKYNIKYPTAKSRKQREGWVKTASASKQKDASKNRMHREIIKSIQEADLTEKQRLFCLYFTQNPVGTTAYMKAYNCSYNAASVESCRLLANPKIREEIEHLKQLKYQAILLSPDDIVERYMRIAFSDMSDVAEWGTADEPVCDPSTGKPVMLSDGAIATTKRNYLHFKDHKQIDGAVVSEVKLGRSGMSVKRSDSMKALDWLTNYFNMNPMNKHKVAYDNAVLALRERELKIKEF